MGVKRVYTIVGYDEKNIDFHLMMIANSACLKPNLGWKVQDLYSPDKSRLQEYSMSFPGPTYPYEAKM